MTLISIIVPCFNEEKTIDCLLKAITEQTIPAGNIEVIIADGLSTDRTRERIERYCQENGQINISIIDNPRRTIPAGLNLAINAAKGEYIVRLDAHSVPAVDYVERCLSDLLLAKGDNVGGIWEILPGESHWIGRSIAAAAAHPLGVGDAKYRLASSAGYVDTVPFGAFHRDLITKIGFFDETFLTNEDYEFNTRIRKNGGKIWLNPRIRSKYFARPNIMSLAKQYWRYGYWKLKMLLRYPLSLRWRQALPPLFVVCLILSAIGSIWFSVFKLLLLVIFSVYFVILLIGAMMTSRKKNDITLILGIPLAITTMHVCWGSAFIYSGLASLFNSLISSTTQKKENFHQDES